MARDVPRSIRLSAEYDDALHLLAKARGFKPATFAAHILEEAIDKMLDPIAITQQCEANRRRQLEEAAEIRKRIRKS